jgi:hypothetical protein
MGCDRQTEKNRGNGQLKQKNQGKTRGAIKGENSFALFGSNGMLTPKAA